MYLAMPEICTRYNAPVLGLTQYLYYSDHWSDSARIPSLRPIANPASMTPEISDANQTKENRYMQPQFPVRKWRAAAALIALLAGPILGMILNAAPAQAVPSADPSKEIVYVDRNGIIRVLDTQGDPLVQWFSPTGGWREIDLGDVNDDGDLEIIAIGSEGGNTRSASLTRSSPLASPTQTRRSTASPGTLSMRKPSWAHRVSSSPVTSTTPSPAMNSPSRTRTRPA